MKQPPNGKSFFDNRIKLLAIVVGIALAFRIVFLILFYHTFYWISIWSDASTYNQWAKRIVENHDWLGQDPFFMTPLYPYFLALVYTVFGFDFLAVRILQLLAGIATVLGVFFIGERLFSRKAAFLAALIAAVYGPFLLSNDLILVETLKVFFLVLTVLLLLMAAEKRRLVWWLLSGIASGFAILCRPTDGLVLLAAGIWIISRAEMDLRQRLSRVGYVLIGALLIVVPVTVRNYVVSGEFILITSNGGLNFYLGNNPKAVGVYYNVDQLDLANDPDGRVYAETVLGKTLEPSQVSAYYMGKALDYIRDEPLDFLRLLGRKALLFLHRKEISQLGYNYQFIASTSIPFLGYFPTFALVGPLALAGCALFLRKWRGLLLLYLVLIAEVLGVVLFFVTDRFRLSSMPFLILFAGAALALIHDQWKAGSWKLLRTSVLAVLIAVLPVDLLNYDIPDEYSTEYEFVGLMYFGAKQYNNAMGAYRESLRYRNTYHIHNNIADLYLATGNVKAALSEYATGNSLNPRQAISTFGAGTAYVNMQDWPSALAAFNRAIELNPRFPPAYLNKGLTLYYMQDYRGALASLEQYVRLEKDPSKLTTVVKDIANLRELVGQNR